MYYMRRDGDVEAFEREADTRYAVFYMPKAWESFRYATIFANPLLGIVIVRRSSLVWFFIASTTIWVEYCYFKYLDIINCTFLRDINTALMDVQRLDLPKSNENDPIKSLEDTRFRQTQTEETLVKRKVDQEKAAKIDPDKNKQDKQELEEINLDVEK